MSAQSKQSEALRRYTSLPSLIDVLSNKRIVLLDPKSWDDLNDAYYISVYKKRRKLGSVLAVCFAGERETYHHWKVFSPGSSGVCIFFRKDALIRAIDGKPGIKHGPVKYRYISDIEDEKPPIEDLPFIKRRPFHDENEYRIVFSSISPAATHVLQIPLDSIVKVEISPWMPSGLLDGVINSLKRIPGCQNMKIVPSSLIDNERWKDAIE